MERKWEIPTWSMFGSSWDFRGVRFMCKSPLENFSKRRAQRFSCVIVWFPLIYQMKCQTFLTRHSIHDHLLSRTSLFFSHWLGYTYRVSTKKNCHPQRPMHSLTHTLFQFIDISKLHIILDGEYLLGKRFDKMNANNKKMIVHHSCTNWPSI